MVGVLEPDLDFVALSGIVHRAGAASTRFFPLDWARDFPGKPGKVVNLLGSEKLPTEVSLDWNRPVMLAFAVHQIRSTSELFLPYISCKSSLDSQ
jgi:hypothetical protein